MNLPALKGQRNRHSGPPGNLANKASGADEYSMLRAEWEFLASACSNAIWGDDRYRDMRRSDFLKAVRRELKIPDAD
jgi:hypothetical protein